MRWLVLVLLSMSPVTLLAQRQLSWDALDVTAHLDDDGSLDVVETQTMIFTGDWNGGERTFNLRPRQRLAFIGMERIDPTTNERVRLTNDSSLNDVDEFAFTDSRTLRWRSRLTSDPAFRNTRLVYAIQYRLSGILRHEDDRYVLDHDFAFSDRAGDIRRFSLALTFADGWTPLSEVSPSYAAGPIAPGRGFVLTIPLRYNGTGSPSANDTRRSPEVAGGVGVILGVFVLSIAGLLWREQRLGRFVPVQTTGIDADWIRHHIVAHPAEVIGAAWDEQVDKDEVSALIARLVAERKLTSHVSGKSLSLTFNVDRSAFEGHERALIDKLFFGNSRTTSTDEIKSHYRKTGFDPAGVIRKDVLKAVAQLLPPGQNPRVMWWVTVLFFLVGAICLVEEAVTSISSSPAPIIVGFIVIVAAAFGQIPGSVFRQRVDWGFKALAASLLAPILAASLGAWFLWYRVGTGATEWSGWMIAALTLLTCWVVCSSVNGLKSRNHREAIAFRKMLAAGRLFFRRELASERPALSDDWFPWVVAFGLTNEANRWSVLHHSEARHGPSWSPTGGSSSSSGSSSGAPSWTGAAGGLSGGAGGGATWAAAVTGMAAGVASPSSGGSGGGGSSGGGSSGGGGGGGW